MKHMKACTCTPHIKQSSPSLKYKGICLKFSVKHQYDSSLCMCMNTCVHQINNSLDLLLCWHGSSSNWSKPVLGFINNWNQKRVMFSHQELCGKGGYNLIIFADWRCQNWKPKQVVIWIEPIHSYINGVTFERWAIWINEISGCIPATSFHVCGFSLFDKH